MDCQQQQQRIFESQAPANDYEWISKNEYNKLLSGFVHQQNAKIRLKIKNSNSLFKIQEKMVKNGKSYELNGTFCTWNLFHSDNTQAFSNRLASTESLIFGSCKNNLKVEYRFGQKLYKGFRFNPMLSLQTPKDLHDWIISGGFSHKSKNLNFVTKITTSLLNPTQITSKSKIQFAKNQMLLGIASEILPGFNCKISKGLLGYDFSPKDYFYLKFQTENIGQLIKGKPTHQQLGFYYLRKMNETWKFALGVKSVNSIENSLNFIVETKKPYHLKAKIDSKLNVAVTGRKEINESIVFSYGIGISNLFQKRSRIQTGMVFQYNA